MLYFNYISKIKFKKRKINTPHVWSEVKLKSLSHVRLFATPWTPWNSPSQNTGVGSHSLLKGIFPTQESNPGFPHCRQILYQLSHQGSPRKLRWVAYPFSSGSCWPRNWTGVSCIAGGLFTSWAIREAPTARTQWVSYIQSPFWEGNVNSKRLNVYLMRPGNAPLIGSGNFNRRNI